MAIWNLACIIIIPVCDDLRHARFHVIMIVYYLPQLAPVYRDGISLL